MAKKQEYLQKNADYLEALRREADIVELPAGVLRRVVRSGDPEGRRPDIRSVVTVHYTGRLINGRVFDDTRRAGVPAALRLKDLIAGWQIAVPRMHVGDRWIVYIPAEYGYGKRAVGQIPANSTLVFDIELVGIA